MTAHSTQVLLIADDADSYGMTRSLLAQVAGPTFDLEWASTFDAGLEAIRRGEHAAYLVDDRVGLNAGLYLLSRATAEGCRKPIIVLTGEGNEAIAVQALKQGAADYLVIGQLRGADIDRAVRFAIERARAEEQRINLEAQLRILTEQMPAILWTTDSRLRFTSCWGTGLAGLNLQPNELVGETLFQYVGTDNEDHEIILPHRRALRGEPVSYEIRWMGHVYRAQVNPLRDHQNQIVGTVGIALDITGAREVESEFRAARRIQESLLPQKAPTLAGFDLAGACHPVAATGGDYYDYIPMPDGSLGIVVADVSRHGFASALLMAATRRLLRTLIERDSDLSRVLSAANRAIAEDTGCDYFITLFFAWLDPKTRSLNYAGAGHEAYLLDPATGPRKLVSTSLPLGVDGAATIACGEPLVLEPGQTLLLFTDGTIEAMDSGRKLFGTPRLLETLQAHQTRPAAEIVDRLYRAVLDFCQPGGPQDDVSIVVLKVC
jgi:FixJ family two-component response regulator